MVELPFLQGTLGAWDLLRYYERRLVADGARPHWGQATFSLSYESTLAAYEKFPVFIAAFAHYNPSGTFDNSFTQRLSLRAAANASVAGLPAGLARVEPLTVIRTASEVNVVQ
jgi:hypothetical protein